MARKLSGKKYLLAFILTLVVFSGGLATGVFVENLRLDQSVQLALEERVNLRSIQLQQTYIDSGIADCNTLNQLLETYITDLGKKMANVINYEDDAVFNDFSLVLRDYFLTEVQFFFTAQEIDAKCLRENVKVLYFYDESSFDTQGDILAYLKKLFKQKMLVFSFNSEFQDEPLIQLLISSYNITEFPAVVIAGETYQGQRNVKEMMGIVCGEFRKIGDVPEQCRIVI